ncbi:protein GRINL1A [Megalops cyprinoides]|uniref:protein GRINL1A n=1 Tax=Megalops cyprinoides TaxID=118141 RepID=UPI001864EBDD|nr:protein GRINL1A [Megalops cyprinoides]
MSSPWTERQGHVGDLQKKSKEELSDILLRQEKLLSNKRFIQSLPDKGKKISDFVEKVRQALAYHEEEERKRGMLSSVRAELQSKYQQALFQRQPGNNTHAPRVELSETLQKAREGGIPATPVPDTVSSNRVNGSVDAGASTVVSMETMVAGDAGVLATSDRTEEKDLVEAFEKVTLSGETLEPGRLSNADSSDGVRGNPFSHEQTQKKPHYIEVLEKTELNPAPRKPKFKPNQLAQKPDGSLSGSSSPSRSPGGTSQLSAEARRQRDRKHLDDITAAKLPLLHHSPAQLLSLEESSALQREQERKYEELQAKLAAQKLSKRLGVSMGSYNPEGGQMGVYREVHDNASGHSDED